MKKIIRLTEKDLNNLVKKIVSEDMESSLNSNKKWLSVKNKIPANLPKMSIGAFCERLGNQGYGNINIEEPLANIKVFVVGPLEPGDPPVSRMIILDPLDKKWVELTK